MAASQMIGIVSSWFNGEGGYGFIRPDDGGEAVFVHHTDVAAYAKARSLKKGVRVSYEVTREKMAGLWAKNVCAIDGPNQGGCRSSLIVATTSCQKPH